jgi:DNA modification methylase
MEHRKLSRINIDEVRHIDGFPQGSDEHIAALSDAPHYTACPNPFIAELVNESVDDDQYQREPFAADVSEGKKDPVYNAHSYHTKVPYKAIMRYILHYTNPGDIIFDGFCGSGMAGVAAQMCGADNLALRLDMGVMNEENWGSRKAVISDLSPMATFIASLYTTPVNLQKLDEAFRVVLKKAQEECAWMYETTPEDPTTSFLGETTGHVDYTVWSDVFICPHCGAEVVFWDAAVDKKTGSVKDTFACGTCGVNITKKACARAQHSYFDEKLGTVVSMTKQVPVMISYTYNGNEFTKTPDESDIALVAKIESSNIPYWYPTDRMPVGGESRRNDKYGITHAHHFFTKRNLYVISCLWNAINELEEDQAIKNALMAVVTGVMQGVSKLQRFRLNSTFPNMILSGTLYVGSMIREWNVLDWVQGKYKSIRKLKAAIASFDKNEVFISTNSLTKTTLPNNSIDYIFTDPPFGANLNYSELSFMWESWLRVITATQNEAIMNPEQNKGLVEYQQLMTDCFTEYYRVLKPNHWMTVEFHNSKNAVWNAIQQSLQRAGFIVADVRTLDKKQSSFKQITSSSAVKQDLVISAYKPDADFSQKIGLHSGTTETAWAFVRQHLSNLPVVVTADGKIEILSERQGFLLWDRMVAYHIMQGIAIPLDATDFYKGLDDRFLKRDNMYFLPDQVNEYDMARATADVEAVQFSLFVSDEKSAIGWLYQQLDANSGNGPQTYAELMPKFMQELKAVDKREKMPELMTILEENFLKDEKGRWYIPDLTKSGDIAKLREKNLLKEFQQYMESKGKLKVFRSEAIRAGFAMLWKEKNYAAIVAMAERLPEETIQEDSNLLMYYDISLSRV